MVGGNKKDFARVVELVDTQDLKSCALWACGFKSRLEYKRPDSSELGFLLKTLTIGASTLY